MTATWGGDPEPVACGPTGLSGTLSFSHMGADPAVGQTDFAAAWAPDGSRLALGAEVTIAVPLIAASMLLTGGM